MNKAIIEAMQGEKKRNAHKWWRKNGYKILRAILFPIWIGSILIEKYRTWLNNRQEWSEERATEILNYYIPRASEWDEKNKCLYFFDNGLGWSYRLAKRYLKRKDCRFWKVNSGSWGWKMREYLIEKFQLEGFTKEIGICDDGQTEISFILNT